MRFVLILGLITLVSGCASLDALKQIKAQRQMNFESKLSQTRGADINKMILSMGPPTKTFQMPNGDTVYTWASESRSYTTNRIPGTAMLNTDEDVSSCEMSFIVGKDQRVKDSTYRGNHCY